MVCVQVNTLWNLNRLARQARRIALGLCEDQPEYVALAEQLGTKVSHSDTRVASNVVCNIILAAY